MAKKNAIRERRIEMEITVDCYTPEEQAMGWYYYLHDNLDCPFTATCVAERAISPLQKGDEVEIVGMAPEKECEHEMFVEIRWGRKRKLAVSLSQVKPVGDVGEETRQAVADWYYWVDQGYML